jgi:hypothetical protein
LSQAISHDKIAYKGTYWRLAVFISSVDRTGFSETLVLNPALMELII